MVFICYPKCSTCKKAQAWLKAQGLDCEVRDIQKDNPTLEELRQWHRQSGLPLKKFFNTSGLQYKALGLKDKLPEMSEEEQLALLATDGMLVKRPILVGGTGLWLDAVVQGRTFAGGHAGGAVRRELQAQLAREGIGPLLEELRQVDPEAAERLHPADEKRRVYNLIIQSRHRLQKLARGRSRTRQIPRSMCVLRHTPPVAIGCHRSLVYFPYLRAGQVFDVISDR